MSVQFFSKLSQNYIELLKDDEYYDVTIEVVHIKLPNISPEIFQIILEYIYGGILSLNGQDTLNFLKILAAADKLCLQELVNYLQKYLIENNSEDDLQMKEIEIWEHVLKWGLAQNPTLIPDPATWTDDDFKKMKVTLQNCLPLVRFFCLSSKEFSYKVRPYQKLLKNQFYEDLLNFYLDPDSVSTYNTLRPRNIISRSSPLENTDQIIDSRIVDANIASTILSWTNKVTNNKFAHIDEYKFELLLRGSRDGFTPKKFHELCDGKHNTVTFIKIKKTKEIIGGYNPLKWESSSSFGETEESFIFSFKNKNINDAIISKENECANYDNIWCEGTYYENKIRETTDEFSIDDYEVFQIKKRLSQYICI
ncbi:hypothetical protein GLOIN_2v1868410 [Rhizophagus clarus]|uniref:TLDc domain-containing protein n=1 Tax=Rhizophagus clarus TaxID=94130 RepID=A0A8H3MDP5_9GLOM|nr:hypothetical protein GLOIN_2v1868410 [Rhizophagus clarus]